MPSGGSFGGGGSAGLKTAATGNYFLIPAGPAVGTTVTTSISGNTYGGWIEMVAATSAAVYVVGALVSVSAIYYDPTYMQLDIGTGAAAAEVSIGEYKAEGNRNTRQDIRAPAQFTFMFPIPVPIGTRISCRTASDVTDVYAIGMQCMVTLVCINQADVVAI